MPVHMTACQPCGPGHCHGLGCVPEDTGLVALPTVWSFVCAGAASCAYSCSAHVRPCAQGRCGRSPPGSGVMTDFFLIFFWLKWNVVLLQRERTIREAEQTKKVCICPWQCCKLKLPTRHCCFVQLCQSDGKCMVIVPARVPQHMS